MTGTKLTSDAAIATGPKLLKVYGSWSKMLANGELRSDGVIVVKPKPTPKPKAKVAA